MDPNRPAPQRAAALEELGWLRGLARDLCRDPDLADDAVQETMAAALHHRPAPQRSLRGWLATVLANAVRLRARRERRHRARELAAARPEAEPSAAATASRVELQQLVLAAVRELPEPLRATIVARYLDGQPPRAIAARHDIPVATVKARLQRGLAELRARLDHRHGGDRLAWTTALGALPAVATSFASPKATGFVGAAVALLLLACIPLLTADEGPAIPVAAPSAAVASALPDPVAGRQPGARRTPIATTAEPATATAVRPQPPLRPRVRLHGEVRDAFEQPVAGARVELRRSLGSHHPLLAPTDDRTAPPPTVSDARGDFAFDGVGSGPWHLLATAGDSGHAEQAVMVRGDDDPIVLRLQPSGYPELLTVIAVDAHGARAAGVAIDLHQVPATTALLAAERPPDHTATTDGAGTATFAAAGEGALVVVARGPDGTRAVQLRDALRPGERHDALLLRLGTPGGIAGRLTGADPDQFAAAEVELLQIARPQEAYYTNFGLVRRTAAVGGAFAFGALPPGHYALHLRSPRGLRLDLPPMQGIDNSVRPLTVEVTPGAIAEVQAAVVRGGSIRGTVRTAAGKAVADAVVTAVLVPRSGNHPDGFELLGALVWRIDAAGSLAHGHPAAHALAHTDADGRYELSGLPPGRHRIEVFATGLSHEQRTDLQVTATAPLELEHVLHAAGAIQGHRCGGGYLGVRAVGAARAAMVAIVADDGAFTFAGLAAGDHELGSIGINGAAPFTALTRVRVDAGATTFVDLADAGPVRIRGVLRDGRGQPLSATVRLYAHRVSTAPDGAFAFALAAPLRRVFEHPLLEVEHGGLRWRLPFPEAAIGAQQWDGEFAVGGATLDVAVLTSSGQPLPGKITVQGPLLHGAVVALDAQGRARLSALLPGEYTIGASCRDALDEQVTVQVPAATTVQIRTRPSAGLDVLALDRDGFPRARAPIAVGVWTSDGTPTTATADYTQWLHASTGADGRARVAVPVGALLVTTQVWDTDVHTELLVTTAAGVPASVTLRLP